MVAWFKVGYHSVSEVALVPEGRPESSFPTGGGVSQGVLKRTFLTALAPMPSGKKVRFPRADGRVKRTETMKR